MPPADTTSPPVASRAASSAAIASSTRAAFTSAGARIRWPSYPITPRTVRPCARARSARRPASAGSQPQRGIPTSTSTSTSAHAAPGRGDHRRLRVDRDRDPRPGPATGPSRLASSTSLARRRSSPSPAAAMPSTSRAVAQQNVRWPAAARRAASAVDLNALTWGRSAGPGRTAAIVATFRSNAARSTTRAGVVRSASRTSGDATWPLPPCLAGLIPPIVPVRARDMCPRGGRTADGLPAASG